MKLPRYEFKSLEELAWFVLVAAATVLFQVLAEFDPSTIEDWRTWFIALGAAMVRAAAGAALAWLARRGVTQET
jgi:hypothetical protein